MSSRVIDRLSGLTLLRYRFWDIDLLINRTLVYGVLTVSITAFYILVVVGLGTLLQAQGSLGIALLATGLVIPPICCRGAVEQADNPDRVGNKFPADWESVS